MPSKPPSPPGSTPRTVPSRTGLAPSRTCTSPASSRVVRSAEPSGRKASPQGTSRSRATTRSSVGTGVVRDVRDGVGVVVELVVVALVLGEVVALVVGVATEGATMPPEPSSESPPHAAETTAAARSVTARERADLMSHYVQMHVPPRLDRGTARPGRGRAVPSCCLCAGYRVPTSGP
jgi:hypothetical protein